MVDEQRDRNHLPQKHYLGVVGKFYLLFPWSSPVPIQGLVFGSMFVLARAAWFAYLNPKDTDLLYYNWFRRRDNWSPTEDLFDKGLFKLSLHLGSRNKCKKVSRMVQSLNKIRQCIFWLYVGSGGTTTLYSFGQARYRFVFDWNHRSRDMGRLAWNTGYVQFFCTLINTTRFPVFFA